MDAPLAGVGSKAAVRAQHTAGLRIAVEQVEAAHSAAGAGEEAFAATLAAARTRPAEAEPLLTALARCARRNKGSLSLTEERRVRIAGISS